VRAEAAFLAATALDPTYGAAWNNWGQLAERRGDRTSAETGYRTAVALHPDSHYKVCAFLGMAVILWPVFFLSTLSF
jgi:Flp pilus assembly protein TadD